MAVLKFNRKNEIFGVTTVTILDDPNNSNNVQVKFTDLTWAVGSFSVPKNFKLRIEVRDADLQSIRSTKCTKILGNIGNAKVHQSLFVDGTIKSLSHAPGKEMIYTDVKVEWGPKASGTRHYGDLPCKVLKLHGQMARLDVQSTSLDTEVVIFGNVPEVEVTDNLYVKGNINNAVVGHITAVKPHHKK